MAFKEVLTVDADVTISLGGLNKKTNKPNPTRVEGYYIGRKEVEDRKKKSGVSYIHVFQTAKGSVGVWGKTDLDRKLMSAPIGAMLRVTQNGKRATANGDMYVFKVEVDSENTIDVATAPAALDESSEGLDDLTSSYEAAADDEVSDVFEDILEEEPTPVVAAPRKPLAHTPNAEQQARVKALLANARK